jgi:hypothetical protein
MILLRKQAWKKKPRTFLLKIVRNNWIDYSTNHQEHENHIPAVLKMLREKVFQPNTNINHYIYNRSYLYTIFSSKLKIHCNKRCIPFCTSSLPFHPSIFQLNHQPGTTTTNDKNKERET